MGVHLGPITVKKRKEMITVKIRMVGTLGGGRDFEIEMKFMEIFWNSWKILFLDLGVGYKNVCPIVTQSIHF